MADYDEIASKLIKYSELAKEQFIKSINELFSKPEFKSLIENISISEQDIKLPFKRRASEILETKEPKEKPKKEEKKDAKIRKESKKMLNTEEIKKPKKTKESKEKIKGKSQKDVKKEKNNSKNVMPANKPKENKEKKNPLEEEIKKNDKKIKDMTKTVPIRKKSSDSDIFSGTDTESETDNFDKIGNKKARDIEFSSESGDEIVSGSESEKVYNPDAFITSIHKKKEGSIKQTDYWKMQEEEIREVFSSDSHSLFSSSPSSDSMDDDDLDTLISKLKSSPDLRKQILVDITQIVDSYSLLDQSTKDRYKPLLLSLESIKFSSEDPHSKARLNEISAKIKKVTHI